MRKTGKKGFTLTELIVVLVIMCIIAAIAVPLFTNYWRNAEFRKNEENARTVYLAAESKLTYYRSSGQWDSFQKQIKKQAEKDQVKSAENRTVEEAVFPPDQENAVQLNRNGVYLYSTKSRIFSERGTLDFGTEIVRHISGILQFYTTTNSETPITDVYYAACDPDDFEVSMEGSLKHSR